MMPTTMPMRRDVIVDDRRAQLRRSTAAPILLFVVLRGPQNFAAINDIYIYIVAPPPPRRGIRGGAIPSSFDDADVDDDAGGRRTSELGRRM